MKSTGCVDMGLSGHWLKISKGLLFVNLYIYGVPAKPLGVPTKP
jgi:hypothetical protein